MPTDRNLTLSKLQLREGWRGVSIGLTGSGKSYLCRRLLPADGALVILDPKHEIEYGGLPVYKSMSAVRFWKPERFIYRPPADKLSAMASYDVLFEWIFRHGKIFVFIDDIGGIFTATKYPPFFAACYQMGRSKGITILSCIQRPSRVPAIMTSECRAFFLFYLNRPDDVKFVESFVPGYNPSELPNDHSFFYYNTSDRCLTIARLGGK